MAQKKCLYEVLGLQSSATAEEIRSAYRREALRWHPDKVQHSGVPVEQAREKFQAVHNAYEVLSDPLERKWYDSHRSQILSSPEDLAEFELDLWSYFSPSVYSGFGDSPRGFYSVYGEVFGKIHLQEQMFARKFGSGSESVKAAPPFGGATSSHSEVSSFYDYWMCFRTVKDYAWCDEYDLGDAPNRKVRRIMEEENKKSRKREQREFNEAVRQLAAFVKKRDKRVMERQVEVQRAAREREAEMRARREEAKRERMRKVAEYEVAEWAKSDELHAGFDDDEDEEKGGGGGGGEREEFYCIACEKRFRSQKQWENHEKSKKHIERASALKNVFMKEDEVVSRGKPRRFNPVEAEVEAEVEPEMEPEVEPEPEVEDESAAEDDESSLLAAMLSSQKIRAPAGDESEAAEVKRSKARRRSSKRRDEMEARHSAIGAEVSSLGSTLEEPEAGEEGEPEQEEQSKRKAPRRRAKKGDQAKASAPVEQVKKKGDQTKASAPVEQVKVEQVKKPKGGKSKQVVPPSSICEVCGTDFESRNSLFKHIESTKHFALKYKP